MDYKNWAIRDTTDKVGDGIWCHLGGYSFRTFATRGEAEAELSRYGPEYAAKNEVINLNDFYARARARLANKGAA